MLSLNRKTTIIKITSKIIIINFLLFNLSPPLGALGRGGGWGGGGGGGAGRGGRGGGVMDVVGWLGL